jgi:hypothetical protein
MIIEVPPKEGDIVVLKLITGEEVVGKLAAGADYTITRPLTAHQVQTDNGIGVMFGPFLTAAEAEKVTIQPSACITKLLKARTEIRAKYITLTTGLDMPTGSLSL